MQLCGDAGIQLPVSLAEADLLTPYAVAERYGARSPGTLERDAALALAADVVAWAQVRVAS